jgi:hypothetical protein
MNFGSLLAVVLSFVGLIFAVVFAWQASRQLARVRKTPPLAAPAHALAADPSDDVPTMRFKGEQFEQRFGGSRGYDRPAGAWDPPDQGRNWTDPLIVTIVTPLRLSRFSDPKYWTRYLPGVFALQLLLFVLAPLLVIVAAAPTNGPAGTFSPTAAQRQVPAPGAAFVTDPAGCGGSSAGATGGRPVHIAYSDDGNVFAVQPGATVIISYLYGKPVFSPDVPLCTPSAATTTDRTGVAEYRVTGSGSGYVYIPQPNGTVVAKIQVPADLSTLVYVVVAITVIVLCFNIAVLVRLRRATRARYTRV